jgi:small-conductance mechanosensitive channel
LTSRVLTARNFDPTLQRYLANILAVVLNVVLVVAILGYFGVETTSFAALLAGVGLAVGAAWSGLLSNFAAGAFLIIFRPYKVGDYVVVAGGVEGTITEIGLFNTTLLSPDNVAVIVGNAKVSTDTIRNFSARAYRRVDRTAQVAFGVDHKHVRGSFGAVEAADFPIGVQQGRGGIGLLLDPLGNGLPEGCVPFLTRSGRCDLQPAHTFFQVRGLQPLHVA